MCLSGLPGAEGISSKHFFVLWSCVMFQQSTYEILLNSERKKKATRTNHLIIISYNMFSFISIEPLTVYFFFIIWLLYHFSFILCVTFPNNHRIIIILWIICYQAQTNLTIKCLLERIEQEVRKKKSNFFLHPCNSIDTNQRTQ